MLQSIAVIIFNRYRLLGKMMKYLKISYRLLVYLTSFIVCSGDISKKKTSSPMGNDRSPWSQHNVWRHHNLRYSKADNSELETVTRN